jgi:hypothetical protein
MGGSAGIPADIYQRAISRVAEDRERRQRAKATAESCVSCGQPLDSGIAMGLETYLVPVYHELLPMCPLCAPEWMVSRAGWLSQTRRAGPQRTARTYQKWPHDRQTSLPRRPIITAPEEAAPYPRGQGSRPAASGSTETRNQDVRDLTRRGRVPRPRLPLLGARRPPCPVVARPFFAFPLAVAASTCETL